MLWKLNNSMCFKVHCKMITSIKYCILLLSICSFLQFSHKEAHFTLKFWPGKFFLKHAIFMAVIIAVNIGACNVNIIPTSG